MDPTPYTFTTNPQDWKTLVGKTVEIKTSENHTYSGVVYVIDPETGAVVLATKTGTNATSLDFVMQHAIQSVNITSSEINQEFAFDTRKSTIDIEDMHRRKTKLKSWLKENLIEVQEDGTTLRLGEYVTIEYPYGPEQCLSSNAMTLDRIRILIQKMPIE